jgi:hypothetical protein
MHRTAGATIAKAIGRGTKQVPLVVGFIYEQPVPPQETSSMCCFWHWQWRPSICARHSHIQALRFSWRRAAPCILKLLSACFGNAYLSRVFICIQEITQASYKFLYYLDQEIDRSHHHQVGKNSREKVKNKSGRELEYIVGGCQRVVVARRLCL